MPTIACHPASDAARSWPNPVHTVIDSYPRAALNREMYTHHRAQLRAADRPGHPALVRPRHAVHLGAQHDRDELCVADNAASEREISYKLRISEFDLRHPEQEITRMSSPATNITSILKETRSFPPSAEFAGQAHIIDCAIGRERFVVERAVAGLEMRVPRARSLPRAIEKGRGRAPIPDPRLPTPV